MKSYTIEATDYPDRPDGEIDHLLLTLEFVADERERQDARWGGRDHDDRLTQQDWHDVLYRLVNEAEEAGRAGNKQEYHRVMVQIAAVAVAAAQWCGRRSDEAPNDGGA